MTPRQRDMFVIGLEGDFIKYPEKRESNEKTITLKTAHVQNTFKTVDRAKKSEDAQRTFALLR